MKCQLLYVYGSGGGVELGKDVEKIRARAIEAGTNLYIQNKTILLLLKANWQQKESI